MEHGIVLRVFNNLYEVLINNQVFVCHKRKSVQFIMVGDNVYVEHSEESTVIVGILPRKNFLQRPSISNIDKIIVIFSVKNPEYSFYMIDSFLVYFVNLGFNISIIFNKIDLVEKEFLCPLKYYQKIGYGVWFLSALQSCKQVSLFKHSLRSQKIAFVGHSGAGKSTFINSLFPGLNLKTGRISEKLKKGKQTTKQCALCPIDQDVFVADTPGFSLAEIETANLVDLAACFPEFLDPMKNCRFSNCLHLSEPGCIVRDFVQNGKIVASRYESYVKMMKVIENKGKNKWHW